MESNIGFKRIDTNNCELEAWKLKLEESNLGWKIKYLK